MGNILIRKCPESKYYIAFDRKNGTFIRMGENDVDPFCNFRGPELLDISITNFCERECDFCYRHSHKSGHSLAFNDYADLMFQARKAGVLQVALGGGNPNQHPQFVEILKCTRDHSIIPSYTTNGQGLTEEIYLATKKYCGAMAVSWYEPYTEAEETVNQAGSYEIKINIHFLLSKRTLPAAIDLLENRPDLLEKINALVFLNYKPVHSSPALCLTDGEDIRLFFELIKNTKKCKIGFDSCMISYLPLMGSELAVETVDFCEAGRFSAFVSENMLLYPCSFMNDITDNGVDLRTFSLEEGWKNGDEFIKMRQRLQCRGSQQHAIPACVTCQDYEMCRGGCTVFNINRCRDLSVAV
ncbi:MAG: radical SAM protein [Deltaproteobacteria bacterium]|jgi:radical SAM protein with 4Fe4S-binding SPASM domain|nr:radical SAM protein [Deltaproteobacteria bacterium]